VQRDVSGEIHDPVRRVALLAGLILVVMRFSELISS